MYWPVLYFSIALSPFPDLSASARSSYQGEYPQDLVEVRVCAAKEELYTTLLFIRISSLCSFFASFFLRTALHTPRCTG